MTAAELEMEMGEVLAVGRADGAELLAAEDELTDADVDCVEVGVERFDLLFRAIAAGMSDADDVAPPGALVGGRGDDAEGDGVDWISEVGVAAAVAVPVIAEMGVDAERLGVVIAVRIGRADRKVEAPALRGRRRVETGTKAERVRGGEAQGDGNRDRERGNRGDPSEGESDDFVHASTRVWIGRAPRSRQNVYGLFMIAALVDQLRLWLAAHAIYCCSACAP